MRIITLNANGIRSAQTKNFFSWLETQHADVICIQETKAQIHQLQDAVFHPADYFCFYHDAQKKGYSGVALYCKKQPDTVIYGMDWEQADAEGRFIHAQFGELSVISLYLPSGSSGEERQAFKFVFLDKLFSLLEEMISTGRKYIIAGDWNIAHQAIDLKNWKGNQKNSGFLPEERAWLDKLFATQHWFDAFRLVNQQPEQYTWWSNRGQARAKNVGWRIDYQIISAGLKESIIATDIYTEQRFSDHAPLIIDYDYSF